MRQKRSITWVLLCLICFILANSGRGTSAEENVLRNKRGIVSTIGRAAMAGLKGAAFYRRTSSRTTERRASNSQPFKKDKTLSEVLQDVSTTEGCQSYPSLCKNKEEIQSLMQETAAKLTKLSEERETSLRTVNLLKDANAKARHQLHILNKTEQTLLQVTNNSRSIDLEQEKYFAVMLYNRDKRFGFSKKNFGFYVDRIIEPLEYRLSGLKRFLADRKMTLIELIAMQYMVDTSMKHLIYAISKLFSTYEETRIQMDDLSLEEFLFKFCGKNMSMTFEEIEILKHPENPQYAEIAATYGLLTPKYQLAWNMVQSIVKKGWGSGELLKSNLSVPELANIWKSQSFESKLGVSMKTPLIALKKRCHKTHIKLRHLSKRSEFTFRKSDGNPLLPNAIAITGEAVINAIKKRNWNTAGEKMEELKIQYKNYIKNITSEVQVIQNERQTLVALIPTYVNLFKDTADLFYHFVRNETNGAFIGSVLEMETSTSNKKFNSSYKNITNESDLAFHQENFFRNINHTKHSLDKLEAWTRSQLIIFSYVGSATENKEPIIRMHQTLQDVFAFQSVQIKKVGNGGIKIAELLCIISLIRRDRNDYDGYSLKSVRGNCFTHSAVSFTSKAADQYKKAIIQKTVMTEVQKRHSEDPRAILDTVINVFITHSDSRLRSAWVSLSEKHIMCAIATMFPRKDIYGFYNLFHFRPNCDNLSNEEFRQLKKKADTKRNVQNMEDINREFCRMHLCTTSTPYQSNISQSSVETDAMASGNEQPSTNMGARNYLNTVATIILISYYIL